MINLSDVNEHGSYKVFWENGVEIGDFIIGEDGYYAYWPANRQGYITSYFMREVANKLDELNEKWDTTVQSNLTIN